MTGCSRLGREGKRHKENLVWDKRRGRASTQLISPAKSPAPHTTALVCFLASPDVFSPSLFHLVVDTTHNSIFEPSHPCSILVLIENSAKPTTDFISLKELAN